MGSRRRGQSSRRFWTPRWTGGMAGPMDEDGPESRGGSGGVEEAREVLDGLECVQQNFTVNASF